GREALEVIEKAGGNKDEGIGVGGWTIRRDHPMKPSAVQGIVDIPLPRGNFIGGKSWPHSVRPKEKRDRRKSVCALSSTARLTKRGNNTKDGIGSVVKGCPRPCV
ncbi:hypothetical protein WH47_03750, partial [Habropoda laboriosa]